MSGEPIMISKSRARRAVVSRLTDAEAFSADRAIPFTPRGTAETHALRRLIDSGYIRQQAEGHYFADRERLAGRGRRRWIALAGLGAIAATVALLG